MVLRQEGPQGTLVEHLYRDTEAQKSTWPGKDRVANRLWFLPRPPCGCGLT